MLHYPKIRGSQHAPLERCVAFEKYDGTNLHWDWDRDFGWHAFGTRRDSFNLDALGIAQFTEKHAHLAGCADVFRNTLADGLKRVFRDTLEWRDVQSVQAFTEFLGAGSFAGLHRSDEAKELRLFDVSVEGLGMLDPWTFVERFGHLSSARVIYQGKLTGQFAEDVRTGRYRVSEGVVCKGGTTGNVWMVKIKTYAYLDRLKHAFADRWEDYWE